MKPMWEVMLVNAACIVGIVSRSLDRDWMGAGWAICALIWANLALLRGQALDALKSDRQWTIDL